MHGGAWPARKKLASEKERDKGGDKNGAESKRQNGGAAGLGRKKGDELISLSVPGERRH